MIQLKENLEPSTALAPVPVVLVSCGTMEEANICTIAWTGVLNSNPPLVYVSIRPSRYSYEIIKQSGEFVINLPNEELAYQTDYCGTKSGSKEDKFETAGLTKEASTLVKAPAIAECPINLECKLVEIKEFSSHHMFIGEIIAVKADKSLVDEKGKIDYLSGNLLAYVGNNYVVANNKVASRGICLQ